MQGIELIFVLVTGSFLFLTLIVMQHGRRQEAKCMEQARKAYEQNRKRDEEVVNGILNSHKDKLQLRAHQLIVHDEYGGVDDAAWEREKKYFIERHVLGVGQIF